MQPASIASEWVSSAWQWGPTFASWAGCDGTSVNNESVYLSARARNRHMLRKIATDLWVAEQPLRYFGLPVGTRMTVVRSPQDNDLAVISPIRLDAPLRQSLDALGRVSIAIAPNAFHHLFLPEFKAAYPDCQLLAAPGVAAKQPQLSLDRILTEGDRSLSALDCRAFTGLATLGASGPLPLEEFAFFHETSKTLILTDTAFFFDESFPLITQFAGRLLGSYKQLRPSLLEKLASPDKQLVRTTLQRILAWDFERVIVAHGSIIEGDAKATLRRGYENFLGLALE